MKKTVIVASGAVVASLGMVASALAAAPYTVSVNSSTAQVDHKFYASSTTAIGFQTRRGSTTINMGCTGLNAEGVVHGGVTGSDGKIATIKAVPRSNTPDSFDRAQFKGCVGPVGLAMAVEPRNDWGVFGTGSGNPLAGYVGEAGGGELEALVYATGARTSCAFYVKGFADGEFDETAQTITVDETGFSGDLYVSSLEVPGVSNCYGLVAPGDPANFTGSFKVGDDHASNAKGSIVTTLNVAVTP